MKRKLLIVAICVDVFVVMNIASDPMLAWGRAHLLKYRLTAYSALNKGHGKGKASSTITPSPTPSATATFVYSPTPTPAPTATPSTSPVPTSSPAPTPSPTTTGAPAPTPLPTIQFNVKDFGATGNGSTDDYAAIVSAMTAAGTNPLYFPGGTYLISTGLTVCTAGANWWGDGSTSVIKKKGTLNTAAITVSGANVSLNNLAVDGNRAAGAASYGVTWSNVAGGQMNSVYVHSNTAAGVQVVGSSAALTCSGVISSDNVSGSHLADGFLCRSGLLKCYESSASHNDRNGFCVYPPASTSCYFDTCTADDNWYSGMDVGSFVSGTSPGGSIHSLSGSGNYQYGLSLNLANDWQVGSLSFTDTGTSPTWGSNGAGTDVELFGASYCDFTSVHGDSPKGYCVAVTWTGSGGASSTNNTFGTITVNNTRSDTDPALHFSGQASYNTVRMLNVTGASMALSFGEQDDTVTGSHHNTITTINATSCGYCAVSFSSGHHNYVGTVTARDCGTQSGTPPGDAGVISFNNYYSRTVTANTVNYVDNKNLTLPSWALPKYIVWFDSAHGGVSNNRVNGGIYRAGDYVSPGGGVYFEGGTGDYCPLALTSP